MKFHKNKIIGILFISLIVAAICCCSKQDKEAAKIQNEYQSDRDAFTKSVIALAEARDLSQPPKDNQGTFFKLPKETEAKIDSLTQVGLSMNEEIRDEFLDSVHPELKRMYREKLIKGSEIWYEGFKSNNEGDTLTGLANQLRGNQLIVEWLDWFEMNKEQIGNKIF